ncbi:MAG: hypothetical protein ACI8UO_003680 [Verrucomicrobiales bacterium]|jgi:hypothetical protein
MDDTESNDPFDAVNFLNWPAEPAGFGLYSRWIPEKPDHGKWYLNLSYQFTDNFRAGVDYRPVTGDASILANWRVFSEDDSWRPALILGTSNDDFGDINSQSYYGTFSKYLFEIGGANVSIYGGATFIEELDELRPVGGIHLRRGPWSSLFMYSGVDEHFSISRDFGNHTVTFVLFNLELPGIAYGFSF